MLGHVVGRQLPQLNDQLRVRTAVSVAANFGAWGADCRARPRALGYNLACFVHFPEEQKS